MTASASRPRRLAWLGVAAVLSACDGSPVGVTAAAASGNSPAALPAARSVRFVKLVEVTEWNGNPWASVAEFNLIDATGATLDRQDWKASADSAATSDQPSNAIDGNPQSLWHTQWEGSAVPPPPHALTIDMGTTARISGFRYLARQDKSVNGTIANYRFYVSTNGVDWGDPVASGSFADMGAPTIEKTVVFAQQTENHPPVVRAPAAQSTTLGKAVHFGVEASDPDGDPLTYRATGLPAGLAIAEKTGAITGTPIEPGSHAVNVTVADNKGATATVAFAWNVQPPVLDGEPPKPGEVRFVKLEELSEINGGAWASVAEFNLLDANGVPLPRKGWSASADSAGKVDAASNAIDGNPDTLWHTQWEGSAPMPPHSLIVEMARPARITGFRVLPRQDATTNGGIAKFRFYTSANGIDWGQPVAEGDLSTIGPTKAEKTVMLK